MSDEPKQPESPSPPKEEPFQTLADLRGYVNRAVDEIARLRAQNASLGRRLSELDSAREGIGLQFEDTSNPEELKRVVSGFIETIDRYLEKE